jgi:hypothetical protein
MAGPVLKCVAVLNRHMTKSRNVLFAEAQAELEWRSAVFEAELRQQAQHELRELMLAAAHPVSGWVFIAHLMTNLPAPYVLQTDSLAGVW